MNWIVHICLTYFILSFIIPDTQKYLLPIALFSIILDVDHIPGMIKELFLNKKERAELIRLPRKHMNLVRTAVQEPVGVITILILLGLLYFFGVKHILMTIAALAILIHWVIDFLFVSTMPLKPVNRKKSVKLFFGKETLKHKIEVRIIITIISIALFLMVYL